MSDRIEYSLPCSRSGCEGERGEGGGERRREIGRGEREKEERKKRERERERESYNAYTQRNRICHYYM